MSWIPILGEWDCSESNPTYKSSSKDSPSFGVCICGSYFSEGYISVKVKLSEKIEDKESNGRIILGYRSPEGPFILVGLGGYGYAYSVSEYDRNTGFRCLTGAGTRTNLVAGKEYIIGVIVKGQKVQLEIDRTRVFEYVLERPLEYGQVGLFAWGNEEVLFKDIDIFEEEKKAFVIMQFSEEYKTLYKDVIQKVVGEFKLKPDYAGEIFGPNLIIHDITNSIIESKVVIAEITPTNANVFYEVGYAHALHKPTILLVEKDKRKELPFDISGYRCILYENTIGGKAIVEEDLSMHLKAIMQSNGKKEALGLK
jgi:hypothetical protein